MRLPLALLLLHSVSAAPEVAVEREQPSAAPGKVEARFDVTQMVTDDTVTARHLIYTDLRTTVDASVGDAHRVALHGDGFGRISANDTGPSRYDVTRLYLEYGDPKAWTLAAGRIGIESVNQTLVDGGRFQLALGEGLQVEAFGGLMPHPILRTVNTDFMNFGAGYQGRGKVINHSGGASVQLYRGEVDRAFITEGVYLRIAQSLSVFGRAVLELAPREGPVDVSQAYLTVRYRPVALLDLSVFGSHIHALLPNLWWQDWIEQERARRGFTLDGPLPVGSRRSTGRAVATVHLGDFSPYVSGRYDRRHEDDKSGYEGRVGLKYSRRGLGYLDLYGAHRQSFDAQHQLAGLQLGWTITEGVNLDAGGGALRVTPPGGEPEWLFDANATGWVDLGLVSPSLRRAFVFGMYQAFIEPDAVFHIVTARLGYRLSL